MPKPFDIHNCPVLELTGDNTPCGRCYFYLAPDENGDRVICPRHGNVKDAVEHHVEAGKLTREDVLSNKRN